MPASWDEYVDLLRACGELNALTFAPDDDQLRAELYRQFAMNIALGYFMYFQSDASHPGLDILLNSVFLLQPNPDDTTSMLTSMPRRPIALSASEAR